MAAVNETVAATTAWVIYYNEQRSHDSLGRDFVPAEYRAQALNQHKTRPDRQAAKGGGGGKRGNQSLPTKTPSFQDLSLRHP